VFDVWVIVTSPLLKLMTPPLARNKSLHINVDVPNAAPSLDVGDIVLLNVSDEEPENETVPEKTILLGIVTVSDAFSNTLSKYGISYFSFVVFLLALTVNMGKN
jgi:hypothetical protein